MTYARTAKMQDILSKKFIHCLLGCETYPGVGLLDYYHAYLSSAGNREM